MSNIVYYVIHKNILSYLEEMYYELLENRLEVSLLPSEDADNAKDGRMIRAAYNQNPLWYKTLCSNHIRSGTENNKNPKTIIKRRNVLQLLANMVKNKKSCSSYTDYLVDIAVSRKEYMDRLIREEDEFNKWNNQF